MNSILKVMSRQLGRMLLSWIFISGGADAFHMPGGRVQTVAQAGIPQSELAVRANGAVMVLGGGALALGIAPKAAAAVLASSLVPTTLVGHAFWKLPSESRKAQRTQFGKNLGLLGGLLLVLAE